MYGSWVKLVALSLWVLACTLPAGAAPLESRALPGAGASSNAHRSDPSGAYGGLKSRRAPLRSKAMCAITTISSRTTIAITAIPTARPARADVLRGAPLPPRIPTGGRATGPA